MDKVTPDTTSPHATNESLQQIREYIENELQLKNDFIKWQQETIDSLRKQQDEYKRLRETMQQELKGALQVAEGKKQLIDKLLGDIARLQQDVEWYKKTYEERSFLGTIREKLFRKH